MAKVLIEADVKGASEVDALHDSLEEIDKSTISVNKNFIGWTAALTTAALAINKVVTAGSEYLKNLEDTNNTMVTTNELEAELTTSFGMASATLLEYTGVWEAYREVLIETSNVLDAIAGAEAIRRQAQAEHEAFEKETHKMQMDRAKEKKDILEDIAKSELASIRLQQRYDREYEEAQARKKKLIEDEAIAKEKAYEDELQSLDAAIDAINTETQAQIENTEAKREASQAVDEYTDNIQEQNEAIKESTDAHKGYSTEVKQGTEAVEQFNAFAASSPGLSSVSGYSFTSVKSPMERYLEEIANSVRDTNDAVRGY